MQASKIRYNPIKESAMAKLITGTLSASCVRLLHASTTPLATVATIPCPMISTF